MDFFAFFFNYDIPLKVFFCDVTNWLLALICSPHITLLLRFKLNRTFLKRNKTKYLKIIKILPS